MMRYGHIWLSQIMFSFSYQPQKDIVKQGSRIFPNVTTMLSLKLWRNLNQT